MKKKILILGIETSCDETSVSIIQDNGKKTPKILANVISSQIKIRGSSARIGRKKSFRKN